MTSAFLRSGRIRIAAWLAFAAVASSAAGGGMDIGFTHPDYRVYVPNQPTNRDKMDPNRKGDSYNDHFQVIWDEGRKLYYAFWTQASWEGAGDHHICFSRSADRGRTWSEAITLAGSEYRAHKDFDASWQQPILTRSGRLYCFWTQDLGVGRGGGAVLAGSISDDAGETWGPPMTVPLKDSVHGSHCLRYRTYWINWQRPLRLGKDGRYFVGSSVGDGVEFWRFENIDEDPKITDVGISYLSRGKGKTLDWTRMHEGPYFMATGVKHPILAEASVVKLPDGRLFALMRSSVGHPLWSQSRNGGESWDDPKILRTKDGGRKFLQPCSSCPIYDHAGCEAGSGRYFAFIQDTFDFANTNTHYQTRGPYFLIAGKFNANAVQPIEFSEPKPFAGRESGNAFYTSYTVADGEGVLWYPDSKYYLLGRRIGKEWFE